VRISHSLLVCHRSCQDVGHGTGVQI